MKYRAVVYDFDGTIADSFVQAVKIYNSVAAHFNAKPISEEQWQRVRNGETQQVADELNIVFIQIPALLMRVRSDLRAHMEHIQVSEGMRDVLQELHDEGVVQAIVSSTPAENITTFLKAHHLSPLFSAIQGGYSLFGKAAPIRRLLQDIDVPLDQAIYIGDETRDITAARDVPVAVTSVTWGAHTRSVLERERPNYLADTPQELLSIIYDGEHARH